MIDAEMYYERSIWENKPTLTRLNEDDNATREEGELNEEELVLCSRVVRDFFLQKKRWCEYHTPMIPDCS
jgi:hypothetical protein